LSRLQVKTIISLTPEGPNADLISFSEMAGATIVHYPIIRTTLLAESVAASLISAINVTNLTLDILLGNKSFVCQLCFDVANHPVYVHCLDGRRITGLFVALMRRIQGWTPLPTFSEYWRLAKIFIGCDSCHVSVYRYQVSNRTPIPTAEVEKTTKDLEKFCADCVDVILPSATIPRLVLFTTSSNQLILLYI
jgi:hypothetical protein